MSPLFSVPIKTEISEKDTILSIILKIMGNQCNFQVRNCLGLVSSDLSLLGDYIIEQPGSSDRSTLNLTII